MQNRFTPIANYQTLIQKKEEQNIKFKKQSVKQELKEKTKGQKILNNENPEAKQKFVTISKGGKVTYK